MGTTKVIRALEDLIAHLIGIAKSSEVLALREDNPQNLREIRNILSHVEQAKRQLAEARNDVIKEKR